MVPAYVESVLESHHKTTHGFTLQDAVDMILTLDQLIFDSESHLLESIYQGQRKPLDRALSQKGLMQVLEEYMIKWMVDAEPEDFEMLLGNRTLAAEILPHYYDIVNFAEGNMKALQYSREQRMPKGQGQNTLSVRYSFDDAHKVVGGITRSFQSYWQSECDSMKSALVSMDKHATGRVPLSNFYNTAINTDWRFGESEEYLRELGALDETSKWIGPQVIIPNYIQATSNCIVSTAHYLVCCVNECETLMGEIESVIKAPTALPSAILDIVRNMTSQTTLDHDEPAHLEKHMISQLEQVAKNHGGMVPLHGRLFAQWLHYVFPRECPFPHKQGVTTSATPTEFGEQYIASQEEMQKHAENVTDVHLSVAKEELQWMSQWSEDEELMLDYKNEISSSSSWRFLLIVAGLILAAGGMLSGVLGGSSKASMPLGSSFQSHSHYNSVKLWQAALTAFST